MDPSFTATITGTGNVRKNKFDDGGTGPGGFQAINNANPSYQIDYITYDDIVSSLAPFVDPSAVNLIGFGIPYPNNGTDCVSGNGLSRQAAATIKQPGANPLLDQNVPNPAHGMAGIAYQVPGGGRKASLLIRRAVDGQLVKEQSLDVQAKQVVLRLDGYLPGTYFYTLLVDGSPLATRRLVVE